MKLVLPPLVCCLVFITTVSANEIDFNRDIKPVLSDKCYACHGPDAGQRQGGGTDGLRLDTKAGAFSDLDGHFAIVGGDLESSELIRRILSDDENEIMPPSDHRKSLSKREKELLVTWVKEGAKWSGHWAYSAPQSDAARQGDWIDQLVIEKLRGHQLQLSNRADRRILIRRVYFDLIGLPPTSTQVEAFVNDDTPNAWEKLIDELLASRHFGERMAIYWLDLVRYADTVGYHGDQDVSVSPYRDYVINAFNDNMPFDRFTLEQIAGDLIANATQDQLIASGYNKLGMMSAEGGAQPKEYLAKYASDRVRTASTVWMGSTLGCAECHDHKFDPFTQKDFYQFAAFFADIQERGLYSGANRDGNWGPRIDVPDDELPELLQPIDAKLEELTSIYENTDISGSLKKWQDGLRDHDSQWTTLRPQQMQTLGEAKLVRQPDDSILAEGPNRGTDRYTIRTTTTQDSVRGIRIEVLPHESLPKGGPGRFGNGNFVLTEFHVALVDDSGQETPLKLVKSSASFEQADNNKNNPHKGWKAIAVIDGDAKGATWGWAVLPNVAKPQELVVEFETPLEHPSQLVIRLDQNHDNKGHTIGRFRLSATGGDVVINPQGKLPESIQKALAATEASETQQNELETYYRTIAPELAEIRQQLAATRKTKADVQKKHTRQTLITKAVKPREIRVLPRGNWMDDSGEVVMPGVPHFLPPINQDQRASRLDLAKWITSQENPLTARVFVNRLWKMYFGVGLSKVLDDIGSQGEFPTHPILLDALAIEFVDSGWDIKHMIKLMLMSKTYQQSSMFNEHLAELDPLNRLFARQSRFRLDAEMVRDNALAVSGLLVRTIGGRSAKPYQPSGLLRHLNFPKRTYRSDTDNNQYRRGVYTHWQRQFLHPAMKSFDAPAREECTADRPRSNTPLAALVLLNDPSYVEAARVFAERILRGDLNDDRSRIESVFFEALSRKPTDEELKILTDLIVRQRERYQSDTEKAKELLTIGLRPYDQSLDVIELASLTSITRVVFNMHEFITRN